MKNDKEDYLGIAKEVWRRYLDGENKTKIAKNLSISRHEVIAIIKYTILSMYISKDEEKSFFVEFKHWKYSEYDIKKDGVLTGEKATHKHIAEVRTKQILKLKKKIADLEKKLDFYESSKILILGKKII